MLLNLGNASVEFPNLDEQATMEMSLKGYYSGVLVHFPQTNTIHQLDFYDPIRIAQDIDAELTQQPYAVFPNKTIVIPEVNIETITITIQCMITSGTLTP